MNVRVHITKIAKENDLHNTRHKQNLWTFYSRLNHVRYEHLATLEAVYETKRK